MDSRATWRAAVDELDDRRRMERDLRSEIAHLDAKLQDAEVSARALSAMLTKRRSDLTMMVDLVRRAAVEVERLEKQGVTV